MTIDINKIKDERLTEDEKMEIIADYLNGGGGEKKENGVLLHVKSIFSMTSTGGHIYRDEERVTPLTWDEVDDLLFDIETEVDGMKVKNKAPANAWVFVHDSTDSLYKVIGGYYDDMSSGFLVSGAYDGVLEFYRIYADKEGQDNTIFRAERITDLS